MHAATYKVLPVFSIVTALALALAFAPASYTMPPWCPPIC